MLLDGLGSDDVALRSASLHNADGVPHGGDTTDVCATDQGAPGSGGALVPAALDALQHHQAQRHHRVVDITAARASAS